MAVTLKDVATAANVSIPSVSQILNGMANRTYSAETVAKVRRAAADLGYRPNAGARAMRSRRTRQVGVLLRNAADRPMHNTQTFELLLGVNERLEADDYVMCVVRLSDVGMSDRGTSRVFREHMLDGMILVDALPGGVIERVEQMVGPRVFLENNLWRDVNCIRRDEVQVGRLVAEQAAEAGYRDFVWYGTPADAPNAHFSAVERLRGVREVCAERSIRLQEIFGHREDLDFNVRRLAGLIGPGTCSIAYNVMGAGVMYRVAAERGLRVGVDCGLACCDSNADVLSSWPMLARASFDRFAMGQEAARMLMDAMLNGRPSVESQRVPAEWVAGDTLRWTS
jgi:LacI family transcriptional regulator